MGVRLIGLIGALSLVAPCLVFVDKAAAQEAETIPEAFEDAFFRNDETFYSNRSLGRQISWLIGAGGSFPNSFPENEIARDGAAVHRLFVDVLTTQTTSDPYLRTADLPNPYTTSLQLLPAAEARQPAPQPVQPLYTPPPLPTTPAPVAPAAPVPALW